MAASTIPIFTPTGLGPMVDLKNIKVAEMISWGAYKGKLSRLQKKVAGTQIVDNIEIFNYIDIDEHAGEPGSDTYELLQMFGFTDENMQELDDAWNDNDLEDFQVRWDATQRTLIENWDHWLDEFEKQLSTATEIRISGKMMEYYLSAFPNEINRTPKYMDEFGITINSDDDAHYICSELGTENLDYRDDGSTIKATPERLTNTLSVQVMENANDITSSFSADFLNAIIGMILIDGNNIFVKTSGNFTRDNDGTTEAINQVETFNASFNKTFMLDQYTRYTIDDPDEDDPQFRIVGNQCVDSGSGYTGFQYEPRYWTHIWMARDDTTTYDTFELSDGLFYQINRTWDSVTGEYIGGDNHMTVDGLRKSQYATYGYFASEFMEIYSKVDSGGFLKRFIMGLIKAFLSFIDAVVGTFMKIPVLKQLLEIIISFVVKIFGLTYSEAKGIISAIIKAIFIAIIVFYAPVLMGYTPGAAGGAIAGVTIGVTAGTSLIPTIISTAVNMYSSIVTGMAEGAMEDIKKAQEESQAMEVDVETKKAFSGTMGSRQEHESSDDLMYNRMFNPLDFLTFGELPEVPNTQKI